MVDPLKRPLEILALIVALFFIVSTPVAFTLYSLEHSVFNAGLYIQALDEENAYQELPVLIAQTMSMAAKNPNGGGILSIFQNLTPEAWQNLVVQLLPPPILRSLTDDTIIQIMGYLNGERPDVILSLAALKAQMQSPEGMNAINTMLDTQPDCTLEQLSAMALNQQSLTLCNPPDTFLIFDLRPIIAAQINGVIALVPEQVTLVPADSSRPQYLNYLRDLRVLMRLSPLFPIFCLALLVILVVRSWREWLNWWGYPLLLAGLATLFVSVFSAPLASLTFQLLFAPALPAFLPTGVLDLFQNMTNAIVRHALQPALFVAGSMLLAGLFMVALGFLLRSRIQRPPLHY
jgi:hypothetical protein